jgi:hypothetical protein
MKRIMYFLSIFLISSFYSMGLAIPAFCCGPSGQRKCYSTGICCLTGDDQYWNPVSCRAFNVWVRPNKLMFTLATKTPVALYIENKGAYTDNYIVNFDKFPKNPSVIVDLTGVTPTGTVAPGEIKKVFPRISVLATITSGEVVFMVNSTQDPALQVNASLNIIESDYPVSLPEFNLFGLIEILFLAGFVYLFCIKRT